jgi:hypothetical protein
MPVNPRIVTYDTRIGACGGCNREQVRFFGVFGGYRDWCDSVLAPPSAKALTHQSGSGRQMLSGALKPDTKQSSIGAAWGKTHVE